MSPVPQADSWADVKIAMDGVDRAYAKLPPPPVPRDSWSEKVNVLHRTLEGMREQVRTELEQEDLRMDRDN